MLAVLAFGSEPPKEDLEVQDLEVASRVLAAGELFWPMSQARQLLIVEDGTGSLVTSEELC